MLKLSHRTDSIAQSEIRAMSILCRDHDGINMAQGLCDLDVPAPVLEGAQNAMTSGHNIYTSSFGVHTLRQRIAEKQSQWHDQPTTDSEVLVSMGATGAFYTTAQVLLNEGDEVLMFEPYYGYHVSTLQSIGCRVRFIRTLPPSYTIDFDELRDAISPRTKAVLICNPANPSGKVYTREELEQLGTLCEAHNLMLFSDEMYEHFVYDDTPYTSARSISALRERSVIISGFSKIYSITGWRIGYAIAPAHVIEAASHINDLVYVCPPTPLQYGVINGLETLPETYYAEAARSHQKKRDHFIGVLNDVGLKADYVKGAYYVLADISPMPGSDDKEKVVNLLKMTGIATVPARAFYQDATGLNLARFCFSKKEADLERAAEQLKKALL
jgi:aminotransferase